VGQRGGGTAALTTSDRSATPARRAAQVAAPPVPPLPATPAATTARRPRGRLLPRSRLVGPVLEIAANLLGCVFEADSPHGTVAVRLTEVEAYAGPDDPASHAYRGRTARNAVMFGPAGHLYVYFVYGMHWCCNVVCGPEGDASAVLLRAGTVLSGVDTARSRRTSARREADLARGPARLATALGLAAAGNGVDLCSAASPVRLRAGPPVPPELIRTGPRVGVAVAADRPWRFWIDADPSVSPYRPGGRRPPAS
jgi:DNA-3-methyladenine glycosylase